MPRLRAVVAILALAGGSGMPLAAQEAAPAPDAPAQDAPVIDLGPVLDLPVGPDPADVPETGTAPDAVSDATPGTTSEEAPAEAADPVEIVPEDALTLPGYDRALQDGEAGPSDLREDVLLPLRPHSPTLDGIVRLSGEVQRADFHVDLPAGALARDLVLAYRISINVLPKQSELDIRVNGTRLPPVRPTAFEGFEKVTLPGDLLAPGRNEISVIARHAHRIFCGPEATFAVWTEIDADASGATLARTGLPTNSAGLRTVLRAQVAQTGGIPVRIADPETEGVLADLTPRLAGLRGDAPVPLQPQAFHALAEGVPQIARITVLPGDRSFADVRPAADGTLVLVLTIGPGGELPDLDTLLPRPLPEPGLALLRPGAPAALRSLGFDRTEAFNRYSEQQVTFLLPHDWLVLTAQKAQLRLAYGFADGLPEGALMLVKVNGTTVQLLPLDRDGGDDLPVLDIDFPARLMRPGANALTFVAIVPGDPPDLPCRQPPGPLLTVDAASTLEVPPSPRMRGIGLSEPLMALRPDQIAPASDIAGGARGTALVENLASAFRPIAGIERREAASLVVTGGNAPEGLDLSDLGIGRRDLVRLFPATLPGRAPDAVPDAARALAAGAVDGRPLTDRLRDGLRDGVTWFARLAVPGDGPLDAWLQDRAAEAVLLIPDDEAPGAMWLVTAPEADPERLAALVAQARLSADGPTGRVSVLTPAGTWQNWRTAAVPPSLDEPLTLANFHRVAGNYASWSPLYFGAALLGLTFLSVCLALIFVVTTRGARKK